MQIYKYKAFFFLLKMNFHYVYESKLFRSVILMLNFCAEYSLEVSIGVPMASDSVLMRDPGQMNEPLSSLVNVFVQF